MKEKYFKYAKLAAKKADYEGASSVKIGAVAVYKGSILAESWNTNKTSPLQAKYNIYRFKDDRYPAKAHCETLLIQRLKNICGKDFPWDKIDIYIYREYKNGLLANCAPCPSCHKMLMDYGIKRVFYTSNYGYIQENFIYENQCRIRPH